MPTRERAAPARAGFRPARERAARARVTFAPDRTTRVPVELWIEEEGEALLLQRAANLSPGGAVFSHTMPRDPGSRVRVRFTLPGEHASVHCEGEVVASQGGGDDWELGVR